MAQKVLANGHIQYVLVHRSKPGGQAFGFFMVVNAYDIPVEDSACST